MELSSGVSTSGLRRFLKHLALVSVKYKDREDAKLGLKKQIKKLKASALGKKTKQKIMDEFRELEQNISLVLEKESEILRMRTGGMVYKDIMREIEENKREVAKINNTLSQLKGRFGEAVDTKSDRENRIKKLEKKMRVSRIKKKTLPEISDRLKLLEQKYDEIRHNSNYNKEDLGKIKFKIDSLKLKAAISQF